MTLEFLSEQLGRTLVRQSPNIIEKSQEQIVLDAVREIVTAIEQAHPRWSQDDHVIAAAAAIRGHLATHSHIVLSETEVHVLIGLALTKKLTL